MKKSIDERLNDWKRIDDEIELARQTTFIDLTPNWIELPDKLKNDLFWFQCKNEGKFYVVDCVEASKSLAFDHFDLAKQLATILSSFDDDNDCKAYSKQLFNQCLNQSNENDNRLNLKFNSIRFVDNRSTITFECLKHQFKYYIDKKKLELIDEKDFDNDCFGVEFFNQSLAPENRTNGGAETSILFENNNIEKKTGM
jgi:hypothetical protein